MFTTPYNYTEQEGQKIYSPSKTMPDREMSVRQIMLQHSRGLPISHHIPVYDEENDLPDIRKLDLTDRADLAEEYRQLRAKIDAEAKRKKAQTEKEAEESRIQAEVQKRLTANPQSQGNPPAPSAGSI